MYVCAIAPFFIVIALSIVEVCVVFDSFVTAILEMGDAYVRSCCLFVSVDEGNEINDEDAQRIIILGHLGGLRVISTV